MAHTGSHRLRGAHRAGRMRWRPRFRAVAAATGCVAVTAAAAVATHWAVSAQSGSTGAGAPSTIAKLAITAVSSPAASHALYPGGSGDVELTVRNANPFPVTITGVELPGKKSFAVGFADAAMSKRRRGCGGAGSSVSWKSATTAEGSTHLLSVPLVVGASGAANNPLTVTLPDEASMAVGAPAACANTFFRMPAFADIVAARGNPTATTSPATDTWTS